jgi:hypothetical protein
MIGVHQAEDRAYRMGHWYGAVTAEHNFGSDEQMFGEE